MNNKNLALFDFDGTITKDDTLKEFIKYAVGKQKYYKGLLFLTPMLLLYLFKIIPNYKAKEKLIKYFFEGWNSQDFKDIAKRYSLNEIDTIVYSSALEKIQWHKDNGDKIVVVSASIDFWLEPWCQKYKLDLLSTKLEIKNNKVTGNLLGNNCYGIEKASLVKKNLNLDAYSIIYAYGDSKGDRELLALANIKYYKIFK